MVAHTAVEALRVSVRQTPRRKLSEWFVVAATAGLIGVALFGGIAPRAVALQTTGASTVYRRSVSPNGHYKPSTPTRLPVSAVRSTPSGPADRAKRLVAAAEGQIGKTTIYDPAYVKLAYPGGDVPIERGVCTDVLIRAFRAIGIDLQVQVHEDMVKHFSNYPKSGLRKPDANIDHRRVRNLATFFTRRGAAVRVTKNTDDYQPGDVVTWDLNGSGLAHTGLVVDATVPGTSRHLIVHNIGSGTQREDVLFEFSITGHYRFLG